MTFTYDDREWTSYKQVDVDEFHFNLMHCGHDFRIFLFGPIPGNEDGRMLIAYKTVRGNVEHVLQQLIGKTLIEGVVTKSDWDKVLQSDETP